MNALAILYAAAFEKRGQESLPEDIRALMSQLEAQKQRAVEREKQKKKYHARVALLRNLGLMGGALGGAIYAWRTRHPYVQSGKAIANEIIRSRIPAMASEARAAFKKAGADRQLEELRKTLRRKLLTPAQEAQDEKKRRFFARFRLVAPVVGTVGGVILGIHGMRLFNVLKEVAKVPGFLKAIRTEVEAAAKRAAEPTIKDVAAKVVTPKRLEYQS